MTSDEIADMNKARASLARQRNALAKRIGSSELAAASAAEDFMRILLAIEAVDRPPLYVAAYRERSLSEDIELANGDAVALLHRILARTSATRTSPSLVLGAEFLKQA